LPGGVTHVLLPNPMSFPVQGLPQCPD
jgi:hypothetical protein